MGLEREREKYKERRSGGRETELLRRLRERLSRWKEREPREGMKVTLRAVERTESGSRARQRDVDRGSMGGKKMR